MFQRLRGYIGPPRTDEYRIDRTEMKAAFASVHHPNRDDEILGGQLTQVIKTYFSRTRNVLRPGDTIDGLSQIVLDRSRRPGHITREDFIKYFEEVLLERN